jgi:hypothetical protein
MGWLRHLRRELDAPDLWADLSELEAIVRADATSERSEPDRLLTSVEQRQFLAALNDVKQMIEARADVAEAQGAAMIAVLERIEQSSNRIGRKDVLTIILGHIAGPLISGTLTLQNAQWLLIQIVHALVFAKMLAEAAVKVLAP